MPDITASLCFLEQLPLYRHEKPYRIIPSAEETYQYSVTNIVPQFHENIRIADVRERRSELSLNKHGFQVLSHASKYPVLDDLPLIAGYKNEVDELLAKHLKAEKVICFDFRVCIANCSRPQAHRYQASHPCYF